jgi:hypothetical protein
MEMKTLDLAQSVHTLCTQNEGLADILKQLGFTDITKPGMLATAGRFMTIPKGAALKKIDLEVIKSMLTEHGYRVSE